MTQVTFISDSGQEVKVLLGENSPVLTGGFGGWEVIDRPKRMGMTRWKGIDPHRQEIAVLFDGFIDGESQENRIARLEAMARQPGNLTEPPTVQLDGMALRTDLVWIIESIEWDNQNVIWDLQGGEHVRLRQAAVVHLLQFVDDDVIVTATSPAVKAGAKKKAVVVQVPQGMSLRQIALWAYGDPGRYFEIWLANPFLNADPRVVIPAGTHITIPGIGPFVVTAGTPGFPATS